MDATAAATQRDQVRDLLRDAGDEVSRVLRVIDRQGLSAANVALLERWAGDMRISRGLAPNTVGNYLEAVWRLLRWLETQGVALEEAGPEDIEAWNRDLYLVSREKTKTRTLRLTAVRQFFAWRERLGMGLSPARSIPGPRREKRVARKYTRTQVQRMLAACDRETLMGCRDYSVIMFLLATGARRMEVAGLRMDQIELRPRSGAVRFEGKGAKERIITFEGPAIAALRDWLAMREGLPEILDTDSVWLGLTGRSRGQAFGPAGLWGVIQRAMKAAGIKAEPGMGLHRFRITFATMLYDECNYDVRVIQRLMGHEDIETTVQYIAVSDTVTRARMPGSVLAKLSGDTSYDTPLWLKHRQRNGQRDLF